MSNGKLPSSISAAIAVGAKYYFTNRPCKRGHRAKRATIDGVYTLCRRDWMADYYERVGRARARERYLIKRTARERMHQTPSELQEVLSAAIAAKLSVDPAFSTP
jgi:hypothetical protein